VESVLKAARIIVLLTVGADVAHFLVVQKELAIKVFVLDMGEAKDVPKPIVVKLPLVALRFAHLMVVGKNVPRTVV
jgi:hypothetical protein